MTETEKEKKEREEKEKKDKTKIPTRIEDIEGLDYITERNLWK